MTNITNVVMTTTKQKATAPLFNVVLKDNVDLVKSVTDENPTKIENISTRVATDKFLPSVVEGDDVLSGYFDKVENGVTTRYYFITDHESTGETVAIKDDAELFIHRISRMETGKKFTSDEFVVIPNMEEHGIFISTPAEQLEIWRANNGHANNRKNIEIVDARQLTLNGYHNRLTKISTTPLMDFIKIERPDIHDDSIVSKLTNKGMITYKALSELLSDSSVKVTMDIKAKRNSMSMTADCDVKRAFTDLVTSTGMYGLERIKGSMKTAFSAFTVDAHYIESIEGIVEENGEPENALLMFMEEVGKRFFDSMTVLEVRFDIGMSGQSHLNILCDGSIAEYELNVHDMFNISHLYTHSKEALFEKVERNLKKTNK